MKTKSIFSTIMFIAIVFAFAITTPVYASADTPPTVHQVEEMSWQEIRETDFSEYDMVEASIDQLSALEDDRESHTYTNFIVDETYTIQYPICMTIKDKFGQENDISNLEIVFHKYGKYCAFYIYNYKLDTNVITIGDMFRLPYGCDYYESAYGWGSGDSALITESEENINMHNGTVIKVAGIAYLNKYGEVTNVSTTDGTQTTTKENVMILLSKDGIYMGWYAPYNLRFTSGMIVERQTEELP